MMLGKWSDLKQNRSCPRPEHNIRRLQKFLYKIEYNCFSLSAVCMIYRVVERGRVKCGQYWPADEEGIEQYGSFAVINSGVEVKDHYSVTSLLLQNLEVCSLTVFLSCRIVVVC